MRIKVCGINDRTDIKRLNDIDVDMVGFIFHTESPRYLNPYEDVLKRIKELKKPKVGVFVDWHFELILQFACMLDLEYIQLHGNESPELVDRLSPYFKVIKAFSVDEMFDFDSCDSYKNADLFLFDTKGKNPGGNGTKFNWDILKNYNGKKPFLLSGGISFEDINELKKVTHPMLHGFDINSKFEHQPGEKELSLVKHFVDEIKQDVVMKEGYYGEFGGAYIPELLYKPVEELKRAFKSAKNDPEFERTYLQLLKDYVGRPTPLYYAQNLSDKYEATIYLKREDLNHTGAHKINNTIGQILLAKRMGKTRIIAETGAGQHGVATATVCARMGIKCVVYMGAVDIERQKPNVGRMKMLGAEVIPARSGSQTLKDATNEAIRDWINNPDSFYLIGSVVGPHPYPEIVAHFQSVISAEMRKQLEDKTGKESPDMIVACVGGGSNAAGAFYHYLHEPGVELIAVEAAGHGIQSGMSAATSVLGSVGIIHGSKTLMMQDEYGQIIEPHSISAGLDYPGIGPLHAHLIVSGRSKAVAVTDKEALYAGLNLTRIEGIIPALESAHALAALDKIELKGKTVVLNLSGRGDKDLSTYLNYLTEEENEIEIKE